LDGGVDRGCRGTKADDYDASYYTLFNSIASLEDCKAKCQDAAPEPIACPVTGEGQNLGTISSRISEASGLAASRQNPGLYWTHNDSGGRARLFAVDKHGNIKKIVRVKGARARDWEDIAAGPGPVNGLSYVYIADIGDNRKRRGRVQIYRVTEPKLEESADLKIHATSDRFDVRYPDGAHDCEAMFIDQGPAARAKGTSGRVYIITKHYNYAGDVYWVDLPSKPSGRLTFTKAGTLNHGGSGWPAAVTAADMHPEGSLIVVRAYEQLLMFPRQHGQSVEDALRGNSCPVHRTGEKQGEAVTFGADGSHYMTVSENTQPMWYFPIHSWSRSAASCSGIQFGPDSGRCEVWNQAARVQSSMPLPGASCFSVPVPPDPTRCGGKDMSDVDRFCPLADGSGCKVLADNMQKKTCRQYCSNNGLGCVNGWEEENENCVVKIEYGSPVELGCDKPYGTTSDLLCQCAPDAALVTKL
jgi:hypothetical protein